MKTLPLICHPATPCPHVRGITVRVARTSADRLSFNYQVDGDMEELKFPAQARPERVDGLWKHTCFEAFIRGPGAQAYFEFNFSPSSEWAVYRFDNYRDGMTVIPFAPSPRIICKRSEERFEADVDAQLDALGDFAAGDLQLAISAVIQTNDGRLSYWALAHPSDKPDFHHADGFTMTLARHSGEGR